VLRKKFNFFFLLLKEQSDQPLDQVTNEVRVEEGSSATFEVDIGDAEPENIRWFLNNREIRPNSEFEILMKNGKSVLKINEVLTEDSGEVVCEISGKDGVRSVLSLLCVGGEPLLYYVYLISLILNAPKNAQLLSLFYLVHYFVVLFKLKKIEILICL